MHKKTFENFKKCVVFFNLNKKLSIISNKKNINFISNLNNFSKDKLSNINNEKLKNKFFCLYSNSLSTFCNKILLKNSDKKQEQFDSDFIIYGDNPEKVLKKLDIYLKDVEINLKNILEYSTLKNKDNIINSLNNLLLCPIKIPHENESTKSIVNLIINRYELLFKNCIAIDDSRILILILKFIDILELDPQIIREIFNNSCNKIEKFDLYLTITILDYSNNYLKDDFTYLCYFLSKYQISNKLIWNKYELFILSDKNKNIDYNIAEFSRLILAFSTISNPSSNLIFTKDLYKFLISRIEEKIDNISSLDTFRLCMSLNKKTINYSKNIVSQKVFNHLQVTFLNNLYKYDLYQMSNILILLAEYSYIDEFSFKKIENEVLEEYINKVETIKDLKLSINNSITKIDYLDFNNISYLEDLSLLCFSLATSKAGSETFWNKILMLIQNKVMNNYNNLTEAALENYIFCCYRIIDASVSETLKLNIERVLKIFENIIIEKKLLKNNIINPFNTMMPFSRINNYNQLIWDEITKNILEVMNNEKFKPNIYVLSDIASAFCNYNINESYNNTFYSLNFNKFWNRYSKLFEKIKEEEMYNTNILSNLILELSQLSKKKLEETNISEIILSAWNKINKAVEHCLIESIKKIKLNKNSIDNFNCYNIFNTFSYSLLTIGYSNYGFNNLNKELYNSLLKYFILNKNKFDIIELKRIGLCFFTSIESKEFWNNYEEALIKIINDNPNNIRIPLDFVSDMQIPFILVNVSNKTIWKKFAECFLINKKLIENNIEFLMNSIYAFPRSKAIESEVFYITVIDILTKKLNKLNDLNKQNNLIFDLNDLIHIGLSFDSKLFSSNSKLFNLIFEKKEALKMWTMLYDRIIDELEFKLKDYINSKITFKKELITQLLKVLDENEVLKRLSILSTNIKEKKISHNNIYNLKGNNLKDKLYNLHLEILKHKL